MTKSPHRVLPKILADKASEVCAAFKLNADAQKLLDKDLTPVQFLDRLLAQPPLHPEALNFLAHALPKRLAMWWGCLCVQLACGEKLSDVEKNALGTVVHWVMEPKEDNRRLAEISAQAAEPGTPAGSLALAAFQSDGSLTPPNLPVVKPPPTLTAQTLSGALHLAATLPPGKLIPVRYRQFLALGIGMALGKYVWQKE